MCWCFHYISTLIYPFLPPSLSGNILAEATDKVGSGKSGSLTRKIGSAMKALGDYSVLAEWLREQVEKEVGDETQRKFENERYGVMCDCVSVLCMYCM